MPSPKQHQKRANPFEKVPASSLPAYPGYHPIAHAFDSFATIVTRWTGSPVAFGLAVLVVAAWAVTGPLFHYSDAWQLVINTSTTVVTFLMVFLIQQSQNKDSVAIHLKLNELMAANRAANDQLIGIEDMSEEDLRSIAQAYLSLADKGNPTHAERTKVQQEVNEAKTKLGRKPQH